MAGNKVFVQGSYVDIHDNEVVNLSIDKAGTVQVQQQVSPEECAIPDVLASSVWWAKLTEAGLLTENGLPTVSRPEAALMADMLASKLDIAHKWKLFEQLWHRNNMRADYNTALEQKKSLLFQEKLKKILS